jgi:hypothetical protein
MSADINAARAFPVNQGRLLDRHRSDLVGAGDPDRVLTALDAHRNPDGGYGWSLEPDLRSAGSHPAGGAACLRGDRRGRTGHVAARRRCATGWRQ